MIVEPSQTIEIVLSAPITTNEIPWELAIAAASGPDYKKASASFGLTNSGTPVVMVTGETSREKRIIGLHVVNTDTAPATVYIRRSATQIIKRAVLPAGFSCHYTDESGWKVCDESGYELTKALQVQSISTVVNELNTVILGSDVVNANATANTIADVSGLAFPVIAGEMYWFRFEILYDAAATTTGSRWSINGPGSPTKLVYTSEYSLAATTTTRNANNIAYDLPAASNATSGATSGNKAVIEGVIQPSSNGNVIARFASEVLSSAITAKAGSRVQYQRVL